PSGGASQLNPSRRPPRSRLSPAGLRVLVGPPQDPSASLPPSPARSTYKKYASRAAFGRRFAAGPLSPPSTFSTRPCRPPCARRAPQRGPSASLPRRWILLAPRPLQSRRLAGGEGFGERYVLGPVHVHHRLDHLAVHRLARLEEPLQLLA